MNHEIKTLSKNKLVVEFENDFETIEVKYKINSIQCTKDVFDPGIILWPLHLNYFFNGISVVYLTYKKLTERKTDG